MQSKVCTICEEKKELESFYKTKDGKFGRHSMCKVCLLAKNKESRDKTKPAIKQRKQKYYLENKEQINKKNRDGYLANR